DLALERQDGLILAIAAHLRRAAGGLPLNDEQFAARRVALLAIGQFPRQSARIHGGLAPREFARLAGRLARSRGINALADDAARDRRMLVEPLAELFVDQLF